MPGGALPLVVELVEPDLGGAVLEFVAFFGRDPLVDVPRWVRAKEVSTVLLTVRCSRRTLTLRTVSADWSVSAMRAVFS